MYRTELLGECYLIIKVNRRNCHTRVSKGHDSVPIVKFVLLQDK